MAFWTDSSFEPKMNYRWRVELSVPSIDQGLTSLPESVKHLKEGIPSFFAKSVAKPSFSISTKEYKLINRTQIFPGNIVWDPISIVLIDTTDSIVTKFVNDYFNEPLDNDNGGGSGTDIGTTNKTGFDDISTTNKTSLNRLKIKIYHLDSEGRGNDTDAEGKYSRIEIWELTNPIIKKFSSSQLSYENGGLSEYTLEIMYDWAFLEKD